MKGSSGGNAMSLTVKNGVTRGLRDTARVVLGGPAVWGIDA
jgi:hypothetical protein